MMNLLNLSLNSGVKMLAEIKESFERDLTNKGKKTYPNYVHMDAAIDWLLYAQKVTNTGGFSSAYSLYFGWRDPFPETTGYIIPTLLKIFHKSNDRVLFESALKAGNWLISIQNREGYFYEPHKKEPMVYDSGQIIFGLLSLYEFTMDEKFLKSAIKSADWIVGVQEENGSWKQFAYNSIPHTYYSRVSWALLELYTITGLDRYKESANKQLNWVLRNQASDGWYNNASFFSDNAPVLHTIAYTIEGLWESGLILNDKRMLNSAKSAADILLVLSEKEGILSGYYSNWKSITNSKCLTGLSQMSIVWLKLFHYTKDKRYLTQAILTNNFVKSYQIIDKKNRNLNGAIASSCPIWGKYMPFNYLNWAAKFFLDSLILENMLLVKEI